MAVVVPSAWFKQREVKKEKILRHLSSRPDKTEYFHILRSICQSELLCDFIIFKEALSELINEGKVERIAVGGLMMAGDLVRLNIEEKMRGVIEHG